MKIQMIKKLGIVSCLAVACVAFAPSIVRAQGNAGFTLQWGNEKDNILDYCLDNSGSGRSSRYYLEIQPQKFKFSEIIITYPEHFNGKFDTEDIKLRVTTDCRGGKEVAIETPVWDKETRRLTIVPKEAIPSKTPLRVVLSNVRNPDYSGFYKLDARVLRADVPVPVVVGSWMITLD